MVHSLIFYLVHAYYACIWSLFNCHWVEKWFRHMKANTIGKSFHQRILPLAFKLQQRKNFHVCLRFKINVSHIIMPVWLIKLNNFML